MIQQTGIFDRIEKKLIPSAKRCVKDVQEKGPLVNNKPTTMELHHMQNIFIALVCTLSVSAVVNVAEICVHRYYKKTNQ